MMQVFIRSLFASIGVHSRLTCNDPAKPGALNVGGNFHELRESAHPRWALYQKLKPDFFRWAFFGTADVSIGVSLAMTVFFLVICLAIVAWIFRTGYRLKT